VTIVGSYGIADGEDQGIRPSFPFDEEVLVHPEHSKVSGNRQEY